MIVTGYIGPMRFEDMRLARRVVGPTDWRVQRLTYEALVRFVVDMVDGKILTAQQVVPFDDVGCVFPTLSFLHEISVDARREIGTFFEYCDRAAGTARNGQPSFQSVQFIHREDWFLARDMIAAEVLRRERQLS
jgi:hypothetical protein